MIVSHKIRLIPTKEQGINFSQACGVSRFTYNWALNQYKEQLSIYKKTADKKDKPNILQLKKEFNRIKGGLFPWVYNVTKCASEQAFANLQTAFTNFFRNPIQFKFPKKHKKGVRDSFYISNDKFEVYDDYVVLPKIKKVKLSERLKFSGKIMSSTVSSSGNKWFISISVDISDNNEQKNLFYSGKLKNNPRLKEEIKVINFCENKSDSIGIDLGIKTAIVTSDKEEIQAPKPLKNNLKKLRRLNKRLHKKELGSKNRNKAKRKLSGLHARIADIRKDWLHKVSKYLCVNYKLIALEDLHVKGMAGNHKLAKAISDVGMGMFRIFMEYKSKYTETEIRFIDRFAPSSKCCNQCGWKKDNLQLSDRIFKCESCKLEIDRDYNASLNILKFSTGG